MAARFPLIVDGSGTPAIKEIVSGDVLDLTGLQVKLGTEATLTDGSTVAWDVSASPIIIEDVPKVLNVGPPAGASSQATPLPVDVRSCPSVP